MNVRGRILTVIDMWRRLGLEPPASTRARLAVGVEHKNESYARYLALGAAETVVGLSEAFRPLVNERGLYAPVARRSSERPPLRIVAAAR